MYRHHESLLYFKKSKIGAICDRFMKAYPRSVGTNFAHLLNLHKSKHHTYCVYAR